MSWTFLGDSIPKAAKRHRCYLCATHIERGERYLARRGIGDDGPVTCKMHIECEATTKDWTEEDWMYHDASEFEQPNAEVRDAASQTSAPAGKDQLP
jgi:hypothetical protein